MDCSPSGSSVHGGFPGKILERVAISSSRGFPRPRDRTRVPLTTEPPGMHHDFAGSRPWAWVFPFPCPLHVAMLKFVALLHVPTVGVIIARGLAINLPQSEQLEFSDRVSWGRGDGLSRSPGSAWDVCSKEGWGRGCWGHGRVSLWHWSHQNWRTGTWWGRVTPLSCTWDAGKMPPS